MIPRNSLIEANQSGLIAEPLIDITPQLPIPDYKASGSIEFCLVRVAWPTSYLNSKGWKCM